MALETAAYISGLNAANPAAGDPIAEGDNHIRLLKSVLKNTFPNLNMAVEATADKLNLVQTLASDPQAQIDTKAAKTITITGNNGLTGGGSLEADRTLALTGQALALHNLNTSGFIVRDAEGTIRTRSIAAGLGLTISNADGDDDNPSLAFNPALGQMGITALADNEGIGAGTLLPDPTTGNFKTVSNVGSFSIAAPTASGVYSLVLEIVNDTGAGAITMSGFTKVGGDTFTTTVGHKFQVFIVKTSNGVTATVVAMQ